MFFASDNTSGAPAPVMQALVQANEGYARSYGNDDIMARVTAQIREVFEAPQASVHLVATGTVANALALATLTPPWGAVFCHRHAHIAEDECGAPEFYTNGAKLVLVPGDHGRMTVDALAESLATTGASGVHGVQRGSSWRRYPGGVGARLGMGDFDFHHICHIVWNSPHTLTNLRLTLKATG